ncbi:fam-l protein [Plasmodium malariae]|uniref:Fam-l protein n=1 Tax=Plasmodium malariae TaxID=5858 RepID=A0A1D3JJW9_PLAMA|nr:fam-l protein [Plasmodium malariae]SBT86829.1 fam-l protein [Plasmodium malariae]
METKIKILFLINVTIFIYLNWICHFTNDMCTFSKSRYKEHKNGDTQYIITYRLLTKCKQDKNSNYVSLKEETLNNEEHKKIYITQNEKGGKSINKQYYKNLLNNANCHKERKKNKSFVFETNNYSRLEKKIFKELDFINFLKKNRTISSRTYENIICKRHKMLFILPGTLLLLLSISFILDSFCECGLIKWLFIVFNSILATGWQKTLRLWFHYDCSSIGSFFRYTKVNVGGQSKTAYYYITGLFGFVAYFLPFFLLGIILISGIIYYHTKVKKYEKLKFRKK